MLLEVQAKDRSWPSHHYDHVCFEFFLYSTTPLAHVLRAGEKGTRGGALTMLQSETPKELLRQVEIDFNLKLSV
ncbi:hypothetical protein TNCV_3415211 [Trichonephila clavipes]|nr:hypothetical protein TNCV_3415211 [Trichonephila clavipes]